MSETLRKFGHDINNALSPASLYVSLLKGNTQDAKTISLLDQVEQSISRAAALAEELLAFAKKQSSP